MRATRMLVCGLLVMAVSGCKSVYTEFNPKTDFSAYRTFAWAPDEEGCDSGEASAVPALLSYARDCMGKRIEEKGLRLAPIETADVVGCLQIRSGMYGDPEAGGGEPRSQKVGGLTLASLSDTWMPEDEKTVVMDQGTLSFSIRDRAKDVVVWQGWVERSIDLDDAQATGEKPKAGALRELPSRAREGIGRAVKALAEKVPGFGVRLDR